MIRKLHLTILPLFLSLIVSAQSVNMIKSDRETYIFGEGEGVTVREADQKALADIISQISVSVKSDFSLENSEKGEDFDQTFHSIINTYSNATLTNTERIIEKNEPDAKVFRYIFRSEIERIFEGRKLKAQDMLETAQEALDKRQLNDAIRYYYWAHALIRSLRYPNELFIYDEDGTKQMANSWIPVRINEILSNISVSLERIDDSEILHLQICYKGDPVRGIDYTYFDGSDWSNIYSGIDGEGIIEVRSNIELDKIQLKIEHVFEGESIVDPEIKELLSILDGTIYKKAYITLDVDKSNSFKASGKGVKITEAVTATCYPTLSEVENIGVYQAVVNKVVEGIKSKDYESVKSYFTPEGLAAYNSLIKLGSARVVDVSSPKYYGFGNDVFCRDLLFNFSFKRNNREFIENVIFKFNEERLISNVTFGLDKAAANDLLGNERWPEQARIILAHFLESYQTAYALKQLSFLESIFAEDALIITGSYVRTATQTEMAGYVKPKVIYDKQTKAEYIRKLGYIFRANEFVNINFADNDVIKGGKGGEVYGIQIKQEYHSSSYGDTGYLFLMVDLNNIDKPIIQVRTWQPEKDPNFGQYGLQHF